MYTVTATACLFRREEADMEPIEFLDVVWGDGEGYVDVPSKAGGTWVPWIGQWPNDRDVIRRRIKSCVRDEESVYFSASQFEGPARKLSDALATDWLWADLDAEDPVALEIDNVLPTMAWESSPGRYQAMWKLTKRLKPKDQTVLNKRLTQAVDADPGGWDLTQVLRLVGTTNHKYKAKPPVQLLWYVEDIVYTPRQIIDAIYKIEEFKRTGQEPAPQVSDVDIRTLPAELRRLLRTKEEMVVVGERSNVLYKLVRALWEHGLEEDQIFPLVKPTPWNKWDTDEELLEDMERILTGASREVIVRATAAEDEAEPEEPEEPKRETMPVVSFERFINTPLPRTKWLIEGIWTEKAQGVIGGEPKAMKSTLAAGMAVAVATGHPFLDKYNVSEAGPVLMINAENDPTYLQRLLKGYAELHGMGGSLEKNEDGTLIVPLEVPFFMVNNWGFDLTNEDHRELLVDEIERRELKLVILDTLYQTAGGLNLSAQHELGPMLQWLTALRYKYDCAIALVHHWRKTTEDTRGRSSGQRLMGSVVLHGWMESGLYLTNEGYNADTKVTTLTVEREFRSVAPRDPLRLQLKLGRRIKVLTEEQLRDGGDEAEWLERAMRLQGIEERGYVSLNSLAKDNNTTASSMRERIEKGTEFEVYPAKWRNTVTLRVRRNGDGKA